MTNASTLTWHLIEEVRTRGCRAFTARAAAARSPLRYQPPASPPAPIKRHCACLSLDHRHGQFTSRCPALVFLSSRQRLRQSDTAVERPGMSNRHSIYQLLNSILQTGGCHIRRMSSQGSQQLHTNHLQILAMAVIIFGFWNVPIVRNFINPLKLFTIGLHEFCHISAVSLRHVSSHSALDDDTNICTSH